MHIGKSFRNCYVASILLILLAGCQGNDCVEADDFGEYSTDIVVVNSQNVSCSWTDNADYGEGSQEISACLETTVSTPGPEKDRNPNYNEKNEFSAAGGDCKIKLTDSSDSASCNTLKEAINSGVYSNLTFESASKADGTCAYVSQDDANESDEAKTKRNKMIMHVQAAYAACLDNCVSKCEQKNLSNFETDWEPNNIQTIRGGPGIELSMGQTVEIQVQGAISLLGNKASNVKFNTVGKDLQTKDSTGKYVNLSTGVPISVSGNWCKNSSSSDSCAPEEQVGESDPKNPDIQKRAEFLRRGVLILDPLPNNTTFENNTIKGALLEPNFDAWKCNITGNNSFACRTDYSDITQTSSSGIEHNVSASNEAYPFSDSFAKAIGGTVIPSNVLEYITTNPFENIYCETVDNPNTAKKVRECDEPKTYSISNGNLGGTSTIRNGYFLNQAGGKNAITIDSLVYPSKIAFKIIGDGPGKYLTGKHESGSCNVTVSAPNLASDRTVEVKADGKWYFLTDDDNTTRTLLNRSNYNTLNRAENSQSDQDLSKKNAYSVNIRTESGATWKDKDENSIDCGEGLAIFLLPQNEIIFEKSGFVDFKNILISSANVGACSSDENNDCIIQRTGGTGNLDLNFEIINPMYNVRENTNDTARNYLRYNFHEYFNEKGEPEKQTVTVPLDKWSSSKIFVRKGQILRFSEDNWFKIDTSNGASTIKNKIVSLADTGGTRQSKIGNGLFVKVEERPALLCKGIATEKINNSICNRTTDESGNTSCSVSYADLCMTPPLSTNDKTEAQIEAESTYCPVGCFNTTFVGDTESQFTNCPIPQADDKGNKSVKEYINGSIVSAKTCTNCKELLAEYQKGPNGEAPTKTIDQTIDVDLVQCYDLENYNGSAKRIGISDETVISNEQDISENGNLTRENLELGAKKLAGILDGGTYGSLDGFELDETKKDAGSSSSDGGISGEYTELVYNSGESLPFQTPRTLKFLLLDNEDFEFANGSKKYNGVGYNFVMTPTEFDKNGSQLAIVLANKGWDGKTFDGKDFKKWIVGYNVDKNDDNKYGTFEAKTEENYYYQIGSNGVLTDNNGVAKVDLSKLNLDEVAEDDYKDLRFFFKIIDKPEKEPCKGDGVSGNKLQVLYQEEECNCKNTVDSGLIYQEWRSCNDIQCYNGDGDKKKNTLEVVTQTKDKCVSSYYNNSGTYTVQLKTPKTVLNSTGYIVKYVMEPVLEILDGKTIGLATGTDGTIAPCEVGDGIERYGGNVPKNKIGTGCSKEGSEFSRYCRTATEDYEECEKGSNCILPGLDKSKYGEKCKDENGNYRIEDHAEYCYPVSAERCNIYNPNAPFGDKSFGKDCVFGDENCYRNCSTLTDKTYSMCTYINDNTGFLQRFYQTVINDYDYQVILKLCFTLMIMFYGLYYLLGMADLTQSELIKRLIKISFIYLMVGKDGWYYYNMFFVKFFKSGVDYLVFAIAGAFDDSSSLQAAFVKNDFYDKSVLFSGVDKNLALIFSDQVSFKIWGLLFVSFFGWLYVFLIYSAIIAYIMAVANALLLYLTAQFFVSMLLAFGPIFFVLLIFEKTKGMFDKWISNLISFSLEQIFLLTCLSLFNSLVYNIIKFVLSYRVCWRPVWVLDIPVLGNIELMSFWKATSSSSPTAAANAVPGLFQILIIYLVADLMKNFITFMSDLGAKMGGGGLTSSGLSADISKAVSDNYNKYIKAPLKDKVGKMGLKAAKKLIGYKTKAEEKAEKQLNKSLLKKRREINGAVNKDVNKWKKENLKELQNMTVDERQKAIKDHMQNKRKELIKDDDELKGLLSKKGITAEQFTSSSGMKFASSDSAVSLLGSAMKLSSTKDIKSSDTMLDKTSKSKALTGISSKEMKSAIKKEEKQESKALRKDFGSMIGKTAKEKKDYSEAKGNIKTSSKNKLEVAKAQEVFMQTNETNRKTNEAKIKAAEKALESAKKKAATSVDEKAVADRTEAEQAKFRAAHPEFDPNKGFLERAKETQGQKALRAEYNSLGDKARNDIIAENRDVKEAQKALDEAKKEETARQELLKSLAPTPPEGKDGKPGEPKVGVIDPEKFAAYLDAKAKEEEAKKNPAKDTSKKSEDGSDTSDGGDGTDGENGEGGSGGTGGAGSGAGDGTADNGAGSGTGGTGGAAGSADGGGAGGGAEVRGAEGEKTQEPTTKADKKAQKEAARKAKRFERSAKANEKLDNKDAEQASRSPAVAEGARSGIESYPANAQPQGETPASGGDPEAPVDQDESTLGPTGVSEEADGAPAPEEAEGPQEGSQAGDEGEGDDGSGKRFSLIAENFSEEQVEEILNNLPEGWDREEVEEILQNNPYDWVADVHYQTNLLRSLAFNSNLSEFKGPRDWASKVEMIVV